jgi:ribonucleotide monophosphatase NagD (HAD superfamily)
LSQANIVKGDTPESDIRGTNEFDSQTDNNWYSILVRTGVFQEGTVPKFVPKATVDNVLEAVQHGIEREYRNALKKAAMSGNTSAVIEE